jgi:hypothetical protein
MISNCPIPRPLLGLIGALLLGGSVLTPAAWTQDLIWENQGLTDEQGITSGSTFAYNGATLTVTWSVVTDGGGFTFYASGGAGSAGGGNDWLSYEASQEGGHTGLLLLGIDNTSYDPDDYLQVTLSFSTPQTRLAFSILDVDATNWDDGVEVLYNGTNNVRSDTSLWSFADPSGNRSVLTDNEPGYTGWEGRNDVRADPDENIGNIDLDFDGVSVSSISIRFFSTDDEQGSGSNPGGQKIGFSDFTVVPEPETYAAGVLLLVGLGLAQWRQYRRRQS